MEKPGKRHPPFWSRRRAVAAMIILAGFFLCAAETIAAERFFISIPGPTLSFVHLYYGQERGFFTQEGLDLQILVVRGVIGISSLMSGEIDVTCHAGSGFAAALRGLPLRIISVTHDRPQHELVVAPSITAPADLKGKAIAVGSLEGTAAVIMRRILQAKGLDPQRDVTLLSMDTASRLQSLLTGKVAGGMLTPPSTYLAQDQGYRVMARGKDHLRYLQAGVVATEASLKQKRAKIVRFLKIWGRSLKFYQDNPEVMIPYIQKRLGIKEARLARRMYEDDFQGISLTGILSPEAAKEILDSGREALGVKEPVAPERIFDFSLASEALK
ncbi:MAG: ABC transporter substrate-binding protein [Deltaproteobacteria bacterium]|nr:MAG: ABC transporter substrate-binding protein [Deltaproteobacteria bacterium]